VTRVKICGVTSVDEARLVERCGADAVGVLVGQRHPASDFVSAALARRVCQALPPFIASVVVTHLTALDELLELARAIPCRVLQIHGDIDVDLVRRLRERLPDRRIIGKVSVDGPRAIARAATLGAAVDAIVLDSADRVSGRVGGTGLTHDWSISARIARTAAAPVILAGGLTPDNVGAAIARVRPWAVDVNSGVETPDGRKSESLVRSFVAAARKAG
jgi:phosphoribosylanthranilate isomerase